MRPNTPEDFWKRVDKGGPDDCWLWTGAKSASGYGTFSLRQRAVSVHRLAYELTHGPIPAGRMHPVCHHCDVPLCVNPAHLYLGTPKENTGDIIKRGRWKSAHPGSSNPFAKFTDDQVREIRRLHDEGWSYPRLGAHFGMHPQNIGRICRREGYTEVS